MRLPIRLAGTALLTGLVILSGPFVAPLSAAKPDATPAGQDTDLFSIDVGPLIGSFKVDNIVSEPPIIKASFYQMDTTPRVVVPQGVEAFLLEPEERGNSYADYRIVGKKPRGRAINGSLYLLQRHPDHPRESTLAKFDFQTQADADDPPTNKEFLLAKGRFYQRLWCEEMAGSAIFRHLAVENLKAAGESIRFTGPNWPMNPRIGVDRTIAMMSGGRAVSENLQLDAQLAIPDGQDDIKRKRLSEVTGVRVRAIDWDDFLKDIPTELDPLSKLVPHDQYAVYLPSFEAMVAIVERGAEFAKPAFQWFEPQSRKRDVVSFYQAQLAMPLNALTRQVGSALIDEVAVTGSDPYFRTGTDVAVMMHSSQPQILLSTIAAQAKAIADATPDAKQVDHRYENHTFTEWSTTNRSLSTFVARLGDNVVVSNSLHQMLQVIRCFDGSHENMHDLDEYKFFRQRYPRREATKATLVVVTDAAIRRWCGPTWRIGASRRTRARASIADMTARHADELVRKELSGTKQIHSAEGIPNVGSMQITPQGVYSPTYGTLDFQTPIAEMDLEWASEKEVELYDRWRTRYERRWRRTFDPIAMELTLDGNSIHADLSVIPLMIGSEYSQYRQLVGNIRLKPDAGDPHPESLGSMTMALDKRSTWLQLARMALANGTTEIDLLAWIDDSATIYFDYDEDWMKRYDNRSPWDLSVDELFRDVPIGFFIPSNDNFRMTAFVVAVRSALQRYAPNMIRWKNAKYRDFEYAVGCAIQGNDFGNADDLPQIFYVTTGEGLTLSPNRGVIERAIDRQLADVPKPNERREPTEAEPPQQVDEQEFGAQLAFEATGKGIEIMTRTNYRSGLRRMNRIAWSNLPILNHLRARYPDRDPLEVYEELFGERLLEPSGGKYVWDETLRTYVSNHHGYHLSPKAGPTMNHVMKPTDRVETKISFQDGGLRATLDVIESKQ